MRQATAEKAEELLADSVSVKEAVQILKVGRTKVYDLLAARVIGHVRLGAGSIRIPRKALRQYIESRYEPASA